MTNSKLSNSDFDSSNFIVFLNTWRKPLIIITIIAFVASIIFSSSVFISPKYKSTVVLFPTSTNSISKALLGENIGNKHDIMEFGEEEQTEQMLQLLNSNKIRDRVIKKYDLMNHYEIDPDSKYKNTRLFKEYDNNITFRRTEYMAVKISVLDKDPQMAADIANDIAELLDSTKNEMQKVRAVKGFKIVEEEYLKLRKEIKQMEDSLTTLRKLGVHDYESQSEMINMQLAIELAKGNKAGVAALEKKLTILAEYGGPYVSLRDALEHEKKQSSLIKAKYEEAKVDAEEYLPQKFIVNSAYKAEKKAYPIRWIIVLSSTLSALFLSILVIIFIENFRKLEKKKTIK
ncbi:MAG: hypothetical protein JEY97_11025 [Bacteroidales bacterium]|nr:hypothetical protein [Bacteroidales bacterium]